MKKTALVLASLMLICSGSAAFAQIHGSIDPAADPGGASCTLPNVGFNSIWIVARPNLAAPDAGFFAVEFGVDLSQLFDPTSGASYAGESSMGTVTSGSLVPGPGVQVGFAGCQLAPTVAVYSVNFFAGAPIPGTVYVGVTPSNLATAFLGMAVCNATRDSRDALGGQGIINGSCTIGTQETTWGKVKSLYNGN